MPTSRVDWTAGQGKDRQQLQQQPKTIGHTACTVVFLLLKSRSKGYPQQ